MANGKVFGTSGEVSSLANVTTLCMRAIEESNEKGKSLLSTIEGAESDKVYQQAKETLDYVAKAVELGEEPLQQVTAALQQYANLLEIHGK